MKMTRGICLAVVVICLSSGSDRVMATDSPHDLAVAVIPGTNVLQVFYKRPSGSGDNRLFSRWRNPDGSWSDEANLGGRHDFQSDPTAAAIPGTNVLQVFYRGDDGGLISRWRNPDGSWSAEQDLGGKLISNPAVAALPDTNVLQVFYLSVDYRLISRRRNPDGSWSGEQLLW